MKQSPSNGELHERLGPSPFSSGGFLGHDTRPVDEIINDDARVLESLDITQEQLADALTGAFEKTREGLGAEVELFPNVVGKFYESMGRIPSPFRGEGVFEKGEAVVTDTTTNEKIIISRLSINLIRKHCFFQGKGSRFRIEPKKAVSILRLK
ncbi:MAG: hypothetical protein GF401_06140 [Chitinivibrionales bacterium]|nr:hypothetical protein [Chitinivibrionales bacterium]